MLQLPKHAPVCLTQLVFAAQLAPHLVQVAADVDVLYQTRIQKERFQDRPEDYEKAKGGLSNELAKGGLGQLQILCAPPASLPPRSL